MEYLEHLQLWLGVGFAGDTPATTSSLEYLELLLEAAECIGRESVLILGREE